MTVSVELLKAQLNLDHGDDDVFLAHKIAAATAYVENQIGKPLGSYGMYPAPLTEAILQLAAYWYEQREAVAIGTSANIVPLGVTDLIRPYREWSFA